MKLVVELALLEYLLILAWIFRIYVARGIVYVASVLTLGLVGLFVLCGPLLAWLDDKAE